MSESSNLAPRGYDIARKLSPAVIIGDARRRPERPIFVYRIAGVVNGYERSEKNSAYGEYIRLIGEFQAVLFETGEVLVGLAAFLPAGVAELYAARIDSNPGKQFNLLYDIGLAPDPRENPPPGTPKVKYIYVIRSPLDDNVDSPSHRLLISAPLPAGAKQLSTGKIPVGPAVNPPVQDTSTPKLPGMDD